ncbi:ankyrin repeat, SAM and basic leucine zipper domain-containing protein 1 [Pararge aegeria]|nr:ankyrin repeat, SAM and basic leucine zipper domain-containing protein 1 [Pararge aegeria]
MANFRPAGLSDEDSDSDDYGFSDKQDRYKFSKPLEDTRPKSETKLQDAIINGDLEGTAKVISEDLRDNVNTKLESGWTPLSHACFHAQENIVQFLLDKGADPNIHADSATPLMLACSNSSADEIVTYNIVSNLIKKGSLLNIGDKYGVTPLMRAAISGRVSVVELILEKDINIEMRDRQGWTAVFWTIYHNQPQCLEILLKKGARWNIVDKSQRSPIQIAMSHDYEEINYILKEYAKTSYEVEELKEKEVFDKINYSLSNLELWQDYYPGLRDESKPKYAKEIPHLLYGMNCDRLTNIFKHNPIDLRTFLLLENEDMVKLGIEMPYERQRLRCGLRNFHNRGWKVNAVAGLQTRKNKPYSTVECLNILGNHLQQLYILETTLIYILRDFSRIQNKIKYEPPDSPTINKLLGSAKKMIENINNLRTEINTMKKIHIKMSRESFRPADLIIEKSKKDIALELCTQLVVFGALSYFAYRTINKMLIK